MAKGKQTYNKTEREKRKRKQNIDKMERRDERKANNNKGKSFEEMLAYVDENGKLSSTPPDPTKKVAIRAEDIPVGIARSTGEELPDGMHTGVVSFFNESKGYGFIQEEGSHERYFVHISELQRVPNEGDHVSFKVEKTERGKSAVGVVPA